MYRQIEIKQYRQFFPSIRETELKVLPQVSQGNQSSPLLLLIKGAAVQSPCNNDSVDILIFIKIS